MAKKKSWLAVVGIAMAALLTVGFVFALFPQKKPCDHVWDEGKVAVEATCGTNGKQVFSCSDCGEVKTEIIKATGVHDFEVEGTDDVAVGTCHGCGVNIANMQYEDLMFGNVKGDTWYRWDLNSPGQDELGMSDFDVNIVLVTLDVPNVYKDNYFLHLCLDEYDGEYLLGYSEQIFIEVEDEDGSPTEIGEICADDVFWSPYFAIGDYLYFYTDMKFKAVVSVVIYDESRGESGLHILGVDYYEINDCFGWERLVG